MNKLSESHPGVIHFQPSSINPKHENFNFDLWAQQVRKQMISVFDKKIPLAERETGFLKK